MKRLHPRAVYVFWWKYFWICFIVIGIIALIGTGIVTGFEGITAGFVAAAIGADILASLAVGGAWARLAWNAYSYEVQPRAIRINRGVIWKHSANIPYERIQNIDVMRGIMARAFGLSDVWIQTAGAAVPMTRYGALALAEGMLPGLDMKDAEKLRDELLRKVRGRRQGGV